MQTIAFHTFGCRLNHSETDAMIQSVLNRGYQLVSVESPADIYVINTCTVTSLSDAKNRQWIRSLHRKNPNAMIAVVGCYSQVAAKVVQEIEGVRLVLGNAEKMQLANYLQQSLHREKTLVVVPKISKTNFTQPAISFPHQTTRAHLKVQDGCNFMCSFCIIPFSRGRSRARDFQDLLAEAKQLVKQGVQEVVLTGVNIGDYHEEEKTLLDVLDVLNSLPNLKRLRISSIEPTTVPQELFERMADKHHNLVPFLHLPLQSGSDDILTKMKRRYSSKEYLEEVQLALSLVPHLGLGTDVMAGFPDETEQQFEQTFDLLQSLPFTYFHVFPFSERRGTPAARMENPVPASVKKERTLKLRNLSQVKRSQFYAQFLGQTKQVLWESLKPDGSLYGYTDNYMKVKLQQGHSQSLQRQIKATQLVSIEGETLIGQLV